MQSSSDEYIMYGVKFLMIWLVAAISMMFILGAVQPRLDQCKSVTIIGLEKSIIEQKYAVEVVFDDDTVQTIFTTPNIYKDMIEGEKINLCISFGKWIHDRSEAWIEQ